MQELVREYLNELGRKKRKRRRVSAIVAAFVIVVAGGVIWSLIQSGIAMTSEAKCGIEEHTHGEECYTDALVCGQEESEGHIHTEACYQAEQTLICGQEESEEHTHEDSCYQTENVLACGQEEGEGHVHTDACHENQLTCGKEEHIHTDSCFIDSDADVEEASLWDGQYEGFQWKEAWGEDLAAAAANQIGYQESTKNYTIADDGSHKGYSRYGQFAGDAYADWDAAFVNFCIHYAGLEESQMFPGETETGKWYEKFVTVNEGNNKVYLSTPDGYEPETGDIIFLKKENEETETQMGIVSSYDKEKNQIKVIEGNSGNEVRENEYALDDSHISEYLMVTEMEKAYKGIPDDSGENAGDAEPADGAEKKADGTETTDKANEADGEAEDTKEKQVEAENKNWAYEESYDAGQVVIHVKAEEGVVPEGAELSVTPIEKKEVTDDMSRKEAKEAEEINAQYELTEKKLQEESEKKEESLQGFLAYDICFVVDGEEVEPSGDVKVTMDFKEAVKPEGVSENATVVVNHLKEDENAEDGVVVEDLTEKEDTTIATSEVDASVEKVELVADGFSTFVITWIYGDEDWEKAYATIQTEYVNSDGNLLVNEDGSIYEGNLNITINKDSVVDLREAVPSLITIGDEYYGRVEIRMVNSNTKEKHSVVSVRTERLEYGSVEPIFCDSAGNEYSCGIMDIWQGNIKLQLVYDGSGGIEIVDDIVQSGNIKVEGEDSVVNQPSYEGKSFDYVWYKQINNASYERVQTIIYENQMTNISDGGKSLNVALDQGALNSERQSVRYKVALEIYDDDGNVIHSVESAPFSVTYYGEVQNGGFERPVLVPNPQNFRWIPEEEVDGWRTTASNHEIEIVCPTQGDNYVYEKYGESVIPAAEGNQFAEINGHEFHGALYQDVLTIKDIPLKYYFSHRARANAGSSKGTNKIYVVIMPTRVAEAGVVGGDGSVIDTRDEILKVVENAGAYEGTYVHEYTTQTAWVDYQDDYTPTDSLTRFFFVSAENVDPTQGNFLDNVWFGQDIPVPSSNTFNLRIEKTVTNLDYETLSKLRNGLSFNIEVKDSNGKFVTAPEDTNRELLAGKAVTLNAAKMSWRPNSDGTYTGFYDYTNNYITGTYQISVAENGKELEGYTVAATSTNKVTSLGGEPVENGGSTNISVSSKQAVEVEFNNTYTVNAAEPDEVKDIIFTKIWDDFEDEYKKRPETLQVKLVGSINGVGLTSAQLEELKISENLLIKTVTVDSGWRCTWENIPVSYGRDKTLINWSVEEMLTNDVAASYTQKQESNEPGESASLLSNGDSDTESTESESISITNVLDDNNLRNWRMVKHSSGSREKTLEGAEFELRENSESILEGKGEVIATATSDANGNISWAPKDLSKQWEDVKKELNGEYVICETKAPVGYSLSDTDWKIEFLNGIPNISGTQPNIEEDKTNGIVFYIGNTALYSLPESGGSGIYWYMFGGILLMAGAALITYKKRCREVLKG